MKIAIVGAGLIGHTIAHMLRETGDYEVVAMRMRSRSCRAKALRRNGSIRPTRMRFAKQ
jgi:saccharopine dehydrogenase-like NADP-dependent oxidoreductase